MPLANFNPLVECDYKAYEHVNPNFCFAGHWFSKKRFGIVIINGARYPFETAVNRVVKTPSIEPDSTADPLDWEVLQADYEYWRRRYHQQGFTGIRFETYLGRSAKG